MTLKTINSAKNNNRNKAIIIQYMNLITFLLKLQNRQNIIPIIGTHTDCMQMAIRAMAKKSL
ncbi:hypothetical protein DYB39_19355 [Providencia rettgeri]|nr:hypothetical protein AM461_03860 [Providencia rettgeri]OBY37041.1 hypothetical protein PR729_10205 [Providencia rettgeri]RFT08665.1 hypothetical protein DYB39_19355 [Providencia rettgeri]